jgi:hypothetical protein
MRFLMYASGALEMEIVCSRLREAGIVPVPMRKRGVYVEDCDLERAKQVLAEAEDFDEEELILLSEGKDPATEA